MSFDKNSFLWRILEATSESVWEMSLDGSEAFFDPRLATLLGYERDEFVWNAVTWRAHIRPEDRALVDGALRANATGAASRYECEYRLRRKDGSWLWVLSRGQVIELGSDNAPKRVVGTYTDITARKETERQLLLAGEELRREAAELAAAKEEADRANKAKTDFLATISHEIRNPLHGVVGMADILLKTKLTAQQLQCVQDLNYSTEILMSIINDILDFSKIESGMLALESAPFCLRAMVTKLCSVMKYQAERKGLQLTLNYDEGIPRGLVGDPVRIRQVLSNLLGNAVKFTAKGGITVNIFAEPRPDGRAMIHFEVIDTGMGIAPERTARLFLKYFQAEESISRRFGGTGLGLAIVKSLVEAMGGTVDVESVEGEGSEFSFHLPLGIAADFHVEEEDVLSLHWRRPPSVLLAEDNKLNRDIASFLLKEAGCRVDLAADGAEAVGKFRKKDYDLVFMDLQMPEFDGCQATAELRRFEGGGRRCPVVAISAHGPGPELDAARGAGVDFYLVKPIRDKDIRRLLASILAPLLLAAAPPVEESPPVFDHDGVLLNLGGSEDMLKEAVAAFQECTPPVLADLLRQAAAGDVANAIRSAHTLKGSAAAIGGLRLQAKAKEFEAAVRAGTPQAFSELAEQVEAEFETLLKALAAV